MASPSPGSLGRPRRLATMVVCEVRNMAGARGGHSCFDRGVWFFAALDAVEKVLHVGDSPVAEALRFKHRVLLARDPLTVDAEAAAIDLERGIRAAELKPAIVN